ncbi:MAG TPA: TetR/AcrR family transcriptional regulator [Streptosporangiaceae bacterium]|jgi:TetR/AcrR family transcriptional regulator, regulator of autoinduction and epiphytic fitness|nr:TetR/AcrR family transcriptional regulator [Streptosporangiaceae bacterium]
MTISAEAVTAAPFSSDVLDQLVSVLGTEEASALRADIVRLLSDRKPADGRVARSHRTRRAIVDAMRALHGEGDMRPSASRIAERAGVSLRTVWQQFADMEALLVEAGRRDLEILLGQVRPIDPGLPLDGRIARLVSRNAQVYERMASGWRAARLHEPFSAELQRSKRRTNALGRAELQVVFGAELGRLDGQQRLQLISALVGIAFWPFWESLRTDVGASPAQARDIVASLLTALLGGPGEGPHPLP